MSDHAFGLAGGWDVWRWFRLRSAGFSAALAFDLGGEKGASAARRLLEQEGRAADLRERAVARLQAEWDKADPDARGPLGPVLKSLRKRKPIDVAELVAASPHLADVAALVAELEAASGAQVGARAELEQAFAEHQGAIGEQLRAAAALPRFREALAWQNRTALKTGVDGLLRQPPGATNKAARKPERLIAKYLQRYCLKNDTVGFFGPVGWGDFTEGPEVVRLHAGEDLIASRTVFFEHWCIAALAERLSADHRAKPDFAPRRLPFYRLEGTTLSAPGDRTEIPAAYALLLGKCDGTRPARSVAETIAAAGDCPDFATPDDVYEALAGLEEQGLISWCLEVPAGTIDPAGHLRELLSAIRDDEVRVVALAQLDSFERCRQRIAAAAGDPEALCSALEAFDSTFTELIDQAAVRKGGQVYAGRTLVYEDCTSSIELQLGRPFLDALGPPLELVLQSARWFTHEVGLGYRLAFEDAYRALAVENGTSRVEFAPFWNRIERQFAAEQDRSSDVVARVLGELQRRWGQIFGMSPAERRVQRRSADLRGAVMEAFAAPAPGWPAARGHAPDLLVAAAGPDALARGEFQIVLGEIHVAGNTLLTQLALIHHPDRDQLLRARTCDIAAVQIAPVEAANLATRADNFSLLPRDLHYEIGPSRSWRPRSNVVGIGELQIYERAGYLRVGSTDGRLDMDVVAFFEQYLTFSTLAQFSLMPRWDHTPRITIDGLVIARERWRIDPATMGFLEAKDELARFVEVQRWARQLGLPDRVFAKVPEEPKPFYVDFTSAIYIDVLVRHLKQASTFSLSEMLPDRDALWLRQGKAELTAELRIACVDPVPWCDPAPPRT